MEAPHPLIVVFLEERVQIVLNQHGECTAFNVNGDMRVSMPNAPVNKSPSDYVIQTNIDPIAIHSRNKLNACQIRFRMHPQLDTKASKKGILRKKSGKSIVSGNGILSGKIIVKWKISNAHKSEQITIPLTVSLNAELCSNNTAKLRIAYECDQQYTLDNVTIITCADQRSLATEFSFAATEKSSDNHHQTLDCVLQNITRIKELYPVSVKFKMQQNVYAHWLNVEGIYEANTYDCEQQNMDERTSYKQRIQNIDRRIELLVFGFNRESQKLLHDQANVFKTIPHSVSLWCALYYDHSLPFRLERQCVSTSYTIEYSSDDTDAIS